MPKYTAKEIKASHRLQPLFALPTGCMKRLSLGLPLPALAESEVSPATGH